MAWCIAYLKDVGRWAWGFDGLMSDRKKLKGVLNVPVSLCLLLIPHQLLCLFGSSILTNRPRKWQG
jgi:hypothetical protein